jgi:ABC-type uncharacterized transport system permease subunit
MFSWGIGIGFGGFALIYLIVKIVNTIHGSTMELYFSPWATIIMTAIVFGICAINIWSKIHKEVKNSIVENIREL